MIILLLILAFITLVTGGNNFASAAYYLVWLFVMFFKVKNSERRLRAFGLAVAGFVGVCVLGALAAFILVPSGGGYAEVNAVIDPMGVGIGTLAPLAAFFATVYKRKKKSEQRTQ